ncbi:MAG: anion permease [Chloroflexi bacterium]|nr:anion permease [Chloroflexota bacterium]
MTAQVALVLVILLSAAALFITEAVRADLVALIVLVVLALTGLVNPTEAFSGFSRPAVITILGLFILTEGLERTGATRRIGTRLLRLGGASEGRMTLVIMLAGALLSLVMNNIAVGAVLLPAVMGISRQTQVKPSRLLMPLSFATMLGGMATLLTTANILVSTALRDRGFVPYGLLDFAPVGVPIVAAGILYMILVGRRWLPERWPGDQFTATQALPNELADLYRLREDVCALYVKPGSPMARLSLEAGQWGERLGLNVIAVSRGGKVALAPPKSHEIIEGDIVIVGGQTDDAELSPFGLRLTIDPDWGGEFHSDEISLVEVVLAPRSTLGERTLREIHFREKFGLTVLAIWRAGTAIRDSLAEVPLQFGDALLVQGPLAKIDVLRHESDFLVLSESGEEAPRQSKIRPAIWIVAGALALAAFGVLPIAEAVMLGAVLMILAGCLGLDEAYRSIEWRAIFLIAAMLPLGIAMDKSGTASLLGQLLVGTIGRFGPLALTGGLLILTTLLVQVMGNVTTAVILAPIAIAAASQIGADPRGVAMAVALGASMAFLTPVAHPVNVLVMGPGGYTFRDYTRVGWPLTVLLMIVALIALPLFWKIG